MERAIGYNVASRRNNTAFMLILSVAYELRNSRRVGVL